MNRAPRVLPPLSKAREDTADELKNIRRELALLEAQQQADDDARQAESEAHTRAVQKTKSVLARRVLEKHRLQAQQRREEATESAAKVQAFNAAMRAQAETHIDRLVAHQRLVHGASDVQRLQNLGRQSTLELPIPNPARNKQRPRTTGGHHSMGATGLRHELNELHQLMHTIAATDASSTTALPKRGPSLLQRSPERSISAPPGQGSPTGDPLQTAEKVAWTEKDEHLQIKAEARYALLEQREEVQRRRALLQQTGNVSRDESIIDGTVVHLDSEANQRAAEETRLRAAAATHHQRLASAEPSHESMVALPPSADELATLASIAHREKVRSQLHAQHQHLVGLQCRLQQLMEEQDDEAGGHVAQALSAATHTDADIGHTSTTVGDDDGRTSLESHASPDVAPSGKPEEPDEDDANEEEGMNPDEDPAVSPDKGAADTTTSEDADAGTTEPSPKSESRQQQHQQPAEEEGGRRDSAVVTKLRRSVVQQRGVMEGTLSDTAEVSLNETAASSEPDRTIALAQEAASAMSEDHRAELHAQLIVRLHAEVAIAQRDRATLARLLGTFARSASSERVAQRREMRRKADAAASVVQALARCLHQTRAVQRRSRLSRRATGTMGDDAAVAVQAAWRGHATRTWSRQALRQVRGSRAEVARREAAADLQNAWSRYRQMKLLRATIARNKRVAESLQQAEAATVMQRAFRNYMAAETIRRAT